MIFPFTFNFSVPGILNPFSKVSSSLSPPVPYSSRALAGSADDNKHSRIHQSPTVDSCQPNSAPNSRSQGALGYRDSTPAPAYPSSSTSAPYNTHYRRVSRAQLPKIERRPSPSPSSASTSNTLRALHLSRKRGWEPTFGAESLQSLSPPAGRGKTDSTTSLTLLSSSGYLDTPAKYRDMAGEITMGDDAYIEGERQEAEEDAPPLKKRRGLAGSIVSTAVSAALIGTAVGLTVYRLWRDRGKEHQAQLTHPSSSSQHHQHIDGTSTPGSDSDPQVPPPPYDPGAWKPPVQYQQQHQQPTMALTPPTPRSKNRRVKRPVGHSSASGTVRRAMRPPRVRPEFDFGRERGVGLGMGPDAGVSASAGQEEGGGVEDKMDWIGDKLSMLIEQGRRALQSEVVVMSEAKEDEVDDGRGGWEEDEEGNEGEGERRSLSVSRNGSTKSRSRAGSVRKTRPRNIVPPPPQLPSTSQSQSYPYSGSISASPRMLTFPSTSSASASVSASTYATPSTSISYTSATASGTTSGGFTPSASLSASLSSYSVKVARGHGHVRGLSYESALPPPSSSSPFSNLISASVGTPSRSMGRETPDVWESPELRESMELARARALARRAGAGGPV